MDKEIETFISIWDTYHKCIVFYSEEHRDEYFNFINNLREGKDFIKSKENKYLFQRIILDIFMFCSLPFEIDCCYHLEKRNKMK
jgi:hypothetical protein